MRSTGKGLHKVFSTTVKEILQELTPLGESGSEVSHFIPEPRSDESDRESIMMSKQDMENLDEKEKFDDNLISTETLHDNRDRNQTHPNID